MSELRSLRDAVAGLIHDGELVFSWGGNPGVGSLHRFRDAVENGWPRPLELDEHSHAGMANRYVAGASGLPFTVLRGYRGTDLARRTGTVATVTCPFTGEELAAVAAVNPDVTVIHAQRADRDGNVQLWGLTGVQKEASLAAKRVLVTVEEVVDRLSPRPGGVIPPSWVITAVAEVPGGAHPSYAAGYSVRDNDFYQAWDRISRDRDTFTSWVREHITEGTSAAPPRTSPAAPPAQIDRYANINTTSVDRGPGRPAGRLPGAGGAPEIAADCGEVLIVLRHSPRDFVGRLDFVTSVGHGAGRADRRRLGLRGRGPAAVITDLGVLRPDLDTAELVLTDVHPGMTAEQVRDATGWPLRTAGSVGVTASPTAEELAALRALSAA